MAASGVGHALVEYAADFLGKTSWTRLYQEEKKTWDKHTLTYDSELRESSLKLLDSFEDSQPLYLGYQMNKYRNLQFEHWFVTNNTLFLEFGSVNQDIYSARVNINSHSRQFSYEFVAGKPMTVKMDEKIRTRMSHVLGMCNYSLCLRNSEHIANYVFCKRWISRQMDDQDRKGVLIRHFGEQLVHDKRRLINTFPATTKVFEDAKLLYGFIETDATEIPFTFNRIDYYLDYDESTYNILVIGPTGAGKSHVINVLFNRKICASKASHHSVTKDILFIRGEATLYNVDTKQYETSKIVVADTVGLCDTDLDSADVINMIKGRINSNIKNIHAVIIVYKAERLERVHESNIKKIINWFSRNTAKNCIKILLVGTHADHLPEKSKNELRNEIIDIFFNSGPEDRQADAIRKKYQLIYVGFPPEDTLNDKTIATVEECWANLRSMIVLSRINEQPLTFSSGSCTLQ